MSKGFKISLLVIFLVSIGYIVPIFVINDHSQKPTFEKEIRSMLTPMENHLVLAMDDRVDSHNNPVTYLYTWFGIKYGSVRKFYGTNTGTDLVYRGLSLSRFWTKKDVQNF